MVGTGDWLFEEFPFAVVLLSPQHQVVDSNAEARRSFGQDAEVGSRFPQRFPVGQHRLPSPEAGTSGWVLEVRQNPPENPGWVYIFREDPEVSWVSEDTERLAFEDPLTGLPNWNILSQFVDHSCSQSQRYMRSSALLRVDLDQLRHVNLELGRAAGDEVLVQAAQRLQNNVRSSDIVGRLEGDQFLILLTELTADRGANRGEGAQLPVRQRAAVVADRLNKAFRQPFEVAEAQVTCHVSVGVAVCPEDARLPNEWKEAAELALAHCREAGGDSYVLYAEALQKQHQQKQERHKQLEDALRGDQLSFRWLEVEGPEPLEHYWWQWEHLQGPELRDSLDSAGLFAAWGKWQKAYLTAEQNQAGDKARLAPLPPAWLNPGFDTQFMLSSDWLWEVDENTLQHRHRLQNLVQLQEKGLRWVLGCTSRGLQNLSLLGRLQPELLKLPLPSRPSSEQARLLRASAQVAHSLGIGLLVAQPQGAPPELLQSLRPEWVLHLP